jgi:hypothetical protein
MDEGQKPAPLTKAEIQEIVESRILIERAERRRAEAPMVIREARLANERLRQIIRQLTRT